MNGISCDFTEYNRSIVLLANVLEVCRLVLMSSEAGHTGAGSGRVADRSLVLSASSFDETFRHFPRSFDVLSDVVGTQSRCLQVAVFFAFQLPAGRFMNNRDIDQSSSTRFWFIS